MHLLLVATVFLVHPSTALGSLLLSSAGVDSGYGTVATHSNPLRQSNDNLLKVVVRKSYPKDLT